MLLAVIMDHQMADQVVQGSSKDHDQPEMLIDVESFFESVTGDGELFDTNVSLRGLR